MKAIETTITIRNDQTGIVRVPKDVEPGEHAALVVIGDATTPQSRAPLNLPSHDVGPWPAGLSLRREDMYGDDGR